MALGILISCLGSSLGSYQGGTARLERWAGPAVGMENGLAQPARDWLTVALQSAHTDCACRMRKILAVTFQEPKRENRVPTMAMSW